MKKLFVALPLLMATTVGFAEEVYVGAGSEFVPGSYYVTFGYQIQQVAFETSVITLGQEEPTTKPGPEITLDVLAFAPSLPIFAKVGLVTGGGKDGFNIGVGADYKLNHNWAIRLQYTHFKVTEDFGEDAEAENLLSVGLKYRF